MSAEKKLIEDMQKLLGVNTPIKTRIENQINKFKSEFNLDSKEHSIFDTLGIDYLTFKRCDKIQSGEQLENYLFQFYRTASDFEYCDVDSIEEVIRDINDFCREYYIVARKVRDLKVLLD